MFIISKVLFGKGKKTVFNVILEVLANTIRQITRERKILKGFLLFAYGIIACLFKNQLKTVGACELNEVAEDETHTRKSVAHDAAAIVTLLPSSPKHRARGSLQVRPGGSALLSGGLRHSWSASILTVTCRRGDRVIQHPNQDISESEKGCSEESCRSGILIFGIHLHTLIGLYPSLIFCVWLHAAA